MDFEKIKAAAEGYRADMSRFFLPKKGTAL